MWTCNCTLIPTKKTACAQDSFLGEVESLFFELAFEYDVIKNMDSYEMALSSLGKFSGINIYSKKLLQHKLIIECWQNNDYEVDKNFYGDLRNNKINRNQFKESINTDIEDEGAYVVSYMVALELFSIYKQDKKSALQILKKNNPYARRRIIMCN